VKKTYFPIVLDSFNMLSKMNSSLFFGFTCKNPVLKDNNKVPKVPRDSPLRLASTSPNREESSPQQFVALLLQLAKFSSL
jgi:hypothetical protein